MAVVVVDYRQKTRVRRPLCIDPAPVFENENS
jgi:hypothetical protein